MNPLPAIADFLEREGGRTAMCMVLLGVAAAMQHYGISKADDLFMIVLGFLGRELGTTIRQAITTTTTGTGAPTSTQSKTEIGGPVAPEQH